MALVGVLLLLGKAVKGKSQIFWILDVLDSLSCKKGWVKFGGCMAHAAVSGADVKSSREKVFDH